MTPPRRSCNCESPRIDESTEQPVIQHFHKVLIAGIVLWSLLAISATILAIWLILRLVFELV